jgi:hypothetical protein
MAESDSPAPIATVIAGHSEKRPAPIAKHPFTSDNTQCVTISASEQFWNQPPGIIT